MKAVLFLSTALVLLVASASSAQELPSTRERAKVGEEQASDAQGGKEKKFPFRIHGFLLGDVAVRTTGERPPNGEGGDFVLGEGRLRLDISGATGSGKGHFTVKGDLFYDAIAKEANGELREGYAGYASGPLDLRLGRQIITWGVGDLFFINDVFPKDWESFFSGRPMEYLKLGVDGVRVRYSGGALNAELAIVPSFTPDNMPSARRFFFFNPFDGAPNQSEDKPAVNAANTEIALRVYRRLADFDLSAYVYRGHWRTPGVRLADLGSTPTATRFYPGLSVYGASAQRGLFVGVLSLEAGYYDSREDRRGTDPTIPNSQFRLLAGYQRELSQDFTAGFQGYGEFMSDYRDYSGSLSAGAPRQDRFRGVFSTRLTRLLNYQTWTLSLFGAFSPTDKDYFLQPEVSRRVSDNLSASLGANIFGGSSKTTFFGQLTKSDNVFCRVRFDF